MVWTKKPRPRTASCIWILHWMVSVILNHTNGRFLKSRIIFFSIPAFKVKTGRSPLRPPPQFYKRCLWGKKTCVLTWSLFVPSCRSPPSSVPGGRGVCCGDSRPSFGELLVGNGLIQSLAVLALCASCSRKITGILRNFTQSNLKYRGVVAVGFFRWQKLFAS